MQVEGGRITLSHLAGNWLFRSSEVLNNLYSSDAFATLLKEAEQFLWAGHEMDLVSLKPSSASFSFSNLNYAAHSHGLPNKISVSFFFSFFEHRSGTWRRNCLKLRNGLKA